MNTGSFLAVTKCLASSIIRRRMCSAVYAPNLHARSCIPVPLAGPFSNVTCQRFYNRKKTLKMPPTKPLKFDYSGDVESALPPMDMTQPKLGFQDLTELQEAEEEVKKIFSLEFADGQDILDTRIKNILDKVKEHPADIRSFEVIVALQTVLIRNQMRHVWAFRKDKRSKAMLIERIQSRKKHMKRLRKADFEKFTWLLEELKIKYVQPKEYYRHVSKRATRKAAARKAAFNLKCEKIKLFREKLEEEKAEFLAHKERELVDIESQLKGFGIEDMSSLSKIIEALDIGIKVEVPSQVTDRRRAILEKKFKMHEEKMEQERLEAESK